MAKTLSRLKFTGEIEITILSNGLYDVLGTEQVNPVQSTILGPVLVIPQENNNIIIKNIDIELDNQCEVVFDILTNSIMVGIDEKITALRGKYFWKRIYNPVPQIEKKKRFNSKGKVYLITGGLGNIGLELGKFFSSSGNKLILLSRSEFPSKTEWVHRLANYTEDDPVNCKIRKIQEMEASGCRVKIVSADVSNYNSIKRIISQIENELGPINGVIHSAGVSPYITFDQVNKINSEEIFQQKFMDLLHCIGYLRKKTYRFSSSCLLCQPSLVVWVSLHIVQQMLLQTLLFVMRIREIKRIGEAVV